VRWQLAPHGSCRCGCLLPHKEFEEKVMIAPVKKVIFHIDIDAFLASVERILDPSLAGKPVVVGSGVVCSASYEARRFGVFAGQPLWKAKRLCPDLIILRGHYYHYKKYSDRIFDTCRDFTPDVEVTSIDEAYLNMTGFDLLYGHPFKTADRLKKRVKKETGLNVTIGVGPNRLIARMASKFAKPNGIACISHGYEASFIGPMPIDNLVGIGRKTAEDLLKFNITRIEQIRKIPLSHMRRAFGENGFYLYQRCRGEEGHLPVVGKVPRSISRETTFDEDTADMEYIKAMLYYLVERAARAMRSRHLSARTITVKIRYTDFDSPGMSKTLPYAIYQDGLIYETAVRLLERLYARRSNLRLVGVALSNFSRNLDDQLDMFDSIKRKNRGRLYFALDRIRDKYGYSAIVAGKSIYLLNDLEQDGYGYRLRTSSLTQ